ncbi:thiamine-binding protein [Persicobacter psychrovividus]|uniref:Thiamine-binding protein domain-containing protein n=1 Tax=Persicobacter psychrovividus TaxID=387638 RepID=A0ABM7VL82_9BACT|nr:hypothetical protein PEPS_39070 [Persicobacter psychrovividus]
MAAVLNFAIFPMDKGAHISEYVSKVIEHIKNSGFEYQLTPMGTILEAPTVKEALQVVEQSYEILEPVADRVYCVMNMDVKKNKGAGMMKAKIESIESKIGNVNK